MTERAMPDDEAAKAFDSLAQGQIMDLLSDPRPIPHSDVPFLPRDTAAEVERRVIDWWLREGGGLTRVAQNSVSLASIREEARAALGEAADQFDVEAKPNANGTVSISARLKRSPEEQAIFDANTRKAGDDICRLSQIWERSQSER